MKHTTKLLALLLTLGLLLTACADQSNQPGQPDDQSAPAADSADHTDRVRESISGRD